jgi:hypothetical protein
MRGSFKELVVGIGHLEQAMEGQAVLAWAQLALYDQRRLGFDLQCERAQSH